jgi:hypothetical protein
MTGNLRNNLADLHFRAWNSLEDVERRSAIKEAYLSDVIVDEPAGRFCGHDGMEQAIGLMQAKANGLALVRTGPILATQAMATCP